MTVNKDMTIAEVLGVCPDVAPVLAALNDFADKH